MESNNNIAKKALIFTSVAALVIIILLILYQVIQVLLLVFAGILLSVFLRGLAHLIMKAVSMDENLGVTAGIVLLIGLIVLTVFLVGPTLSSGINNLEKEIPSAVDRLEQKISQFSWGEELINNVEDFVTGYVNNPEFRKRITGVFSSFLSILSGILVILVIGLYAAYNPKEYSNGFLKLFPKEKRKRTGEILSKLENALLWWMVGRFSSMAIVGILTVIGLIILDVQLAIPLAIMAALFSFVPNLGPIVSAIPAVAMGFVDSPAKALYVVLLYTGVQLVESYIITPQIQKKAVSISPALLLSVQIIIGVLLGIFGLVLATPIMVVVIVIIQTTFIQDTLDDEVEVLGEN